ncbi:hypothetical protein METBIDRAFT_76623 [Metschnikowia bicuspidata var. bicuspidata NRRL YB-4993]|uniref:Zinc finger PHD-type domain-containing protein n=1 Tax=Metschnikowia bicuspidata var. bicuspidata NRRL YB-4993 TaxID=869754 RepID=A0A1A0HHK0_9ASCO|nr:hypothetical protein METBIDRAFT_76623 [Metschnikowia bicuspidata var. bicuspidata NRRL YB-4993]OBA23639.1 hypothetical protein METBIDRAFT_76623 [Metschnikowia bicuspidata var. bicuspidata NRRL YB-4993]
MASVVKSSSSVYSTYISTVDHLPCDIVRSLWVVQACNLAADSERQKLHDLLRHVRPSHVHQQPDRQGFLHAYQELRLKIQRWNREAVAELESLGIQMKTHGAMLRRGVGLLRVTAQAPQAPEPRASSELLKLQLDEHYRENPLASQVEALQERVLHGLRNVVIKHVPGRSSGVKIILKLPKARDRGAAPGEPERYCFCHQPSFGDMIACDFAKCKNGEWFHYKCVGLLNRAEVSRYKTQKWYCSAACQSDAEKHKPRKKRRRANW